MGHSQAEKAASRECVPRIAAHKVRVEGMTRPGIADLTKETGFTHGGCCKHRPGHPRCRRRAQRPALQNRL
jgi:TetR/AcrR family transcriptional regulator, transcriptional repressor for nem operon